MLRYQSSFHRNRRTLLLFLLGSLFQVHSYISPLTPSHTRNIHRSGSKQSLLGNARIGPNTPFENVNECSPPRHDTTTALHATTRKRELWNKTQRTIRSKLTKISKMMALSLALLWSIFFGSMFPPAAHAASTRSGGRMGGSFSRSYSPPSSLSARPSYSSPSTTRMYSSPSLSTRGTYIRRGSASGAGTTTLYYRSSRPFLDVVVPMALYGSILYVNYQQTRKDSESERPLGPGISVLKFSLALDLPNRDDTDGILHSLKHASETISMESREDVSSFVSNVCQELKQQQSTLFGACVSYDHYSDLRDAERQASILSIQERSKFELETINKFGGRYQSNDILSLEEEGGEMDANKLQETQSTCAIVTIVLSIEGDQTKPRTKMNSWQDVWDALSLISAHVVKDDCLLSAEVLWTPERRGDVWTRRDIASFYPDLRVI